jgi:lipopolysaccharide export system protein LptC
MTDHANTIARQPLAAFAAGDKSHAFRAASRHSLRVRLLRATMIGGAAALTLGIALVTIFNPFHREIAGVSIDSTSIDGTKVTMANPRLSGYHKDGRPFTITASAAVQDIKTPTIFELHDLKAQLTMDDQSVTSVTAATGVYDSVTEMMHLTSAVRIDGSTGLQVRAQDAQVAFKTSAVVTDKPVSVAMRGSTIDADSMRVADGGHDVTFEGHVHSVMVPGGDTAAADPAGTSVTP